MFICVLIWQCETGSAASNPTKEKVRTVETNPPTCSSSSNPKVPTPTVQTVPGTESEEEDDADWEPWAPELNAEEVTKNDLALRFMRRMDILERDLSIYHSLNSERFDKIEVFFLVTNTRLRDMEKQLAEILLSQTH